MACPWSSPRLRRSSYRWLREVRPTIRLALPIVAGLVGQMLIGLADNVMVGRVGVAPLAAASLVNNLSFLPFVFSLGLLSSIAVVAAQGYGAGRAEESGEVLRHGLALSAAVGLLTAAAFASLYPFLPHLGQPPEVVAESRTYLLLFAASLAPALTTHGIKQFCEAVNHPWTPALLLLAGVLLNILLNWVFIYGHWGSPPLGLAGAGWASLIARIAVLGLFLGYVLRAGAMRLFHPARWTGRLHGRQFRRLLAIGFPVGAQQLLEVSAFALAAVMMGWMGATALAAHQIALTCASTSFMFALGLGMAACIRVGHAHGAGLVRRRRRIGFVAIALAVAIMGSFGVLFAAAGGPIARGFVKSPEVVALATQLLLLAALFQVADGTQVTALSSLRGLNDVRLPIAISCLAYWLVALPLGYALAFPAKWGAVGIWVGLALGLVGSALALAWRFHSQTAEPSDH